MVNVFSLSIAAVALLAATTDAYRPGDEICSYAISGSSCALSSITPSKTDGSVLIYPGGKTRCAFDDFVDEKTGWVANATYFFQVFPKPQKKKLALILQGGGACIDKATCNFALQCSLPTTLMVTRANAGSTGILDASNPNNAFKDWNIVHVPYCTGDLHVGNAVLDPYEIGIEAVFGRPQCLGQQKKTHLNGFENTKSAFQWAKANYPDVEELVIGGMSAGSLAAQILTAHAAEMWDVKAKGIKYGVLADSYVGVLPDNRPAGQVLNFYGACDAGLPASTVSNCKAGTLTITELSSAMLAAVPSSSWLFVNSMGDATQRLFYQLCKDGIAGFPFANQISEGDFFVEATKILDAYKKLSSLVSTFIVSGSQHVFLNGGKWYETVSTSGEVLGNYMANWLGKLGSGKDTIVPTTVPTMTPTVTPSRPAC